MNRDIIRDCFKGSFNVHYRMIIYYRWFLSVVRISTVIILNELLYNKNVFETYILNTSVLFLFHKCLKGYSMGIRHTKKCVGRNN